jgi:ketosteroid isomerase-like protein
MQGGGNVMNISRRHMTEGLAVLGLVSIGLLGARVAQATSADEEAVAKRLNAFRTAQFAHDAKALDTLCAVDLSYSHSDAHIEDKATFIKNATSDKSKFLSLEYKDPWIRVVGDTAIVRFHWVAESETIPEGKKNSTNLHILMIWQKQGGEWNLLARTATKL